MVVNVNDTEEFAVQLSGISKRFRKQALRRRKSYTTVKTSLIKSFLNRRKSQARYHYALDSVDLAVKKGEAFGVLGRNGSGKSTLLKIITGIYHPDSGSVDVKGRVSALIELGAGFHPEFSGRENIFLAGVMYGLSRKEIENRFEDIVRYAELEDCIEDPVKTYSSGMYMRLGFSVAIHTDPDILIVDEVLAVGDAAFVHRCHETINEFKRQGKTLILVTHDLNAITKWCDRAVWLEGGKVKCQGNPQWVVDEYLSDVERQEERALDQINLASQFETVETAAGEASSTEQNSETPQKEVTRWGSREVEILGVKLLDSTGSPHWLFRHEQSICLEVDYQIHSPVQDLVFGVGIIRDDGVTVYGANTEIDKIEPPLPDESCFNETGVSKTPVVGTYAINFPRLGLAEGSYFLDVAAHKKDGSAYDYHHHLYKFSIRGDSAFVGVFEPEHEWKFFSKYSERFCVDGSLAKRKVVV